MSTGPETNECPFDPDDRVAFAYGELNPVQAEAFRAHLAACPACRQEVDQLTAFADLTQRITRQPEPDLAWTRTAPSMSARRPAWTGWLLWTGATAAVAAAVLLVLLMLPVARVQPGPESAPVAPAANPEIPAVARVEPAPLPEPAPKPAPVQRVAVRGPLELRPAAGGAARTASGQVELAAGDRLATAGEDSAAWESADGTRLELAARSEVALVQTAAALDGERWRLERGELVCKVSPRSVERPFSVEAGPGRVVVKGTRFAARLDGPDTLVVTVSQGVVALSPVGAAERSTDLTAGQQGRLVRGQPVSVGEPDRQARDLLGLASERPVRHRAAKPAAARPAELTTTRPQPAPAAPPPPVEPAAAPASQPGPGLGAAALAAELTADTNWVFDGIRRDMRAGHYEDGLRKLNNYLGDPLGPDRDEATYLKALCLEQLGRIKAARRSYDTYLERWPKGPRAEAAETGRTRTR